MKVSGFHPEVMMAANGDNILSERTVFLNPKQPQNMLSHLRGWEEQKS